MKKLLCLSLLLCPPIAIWPMIQKPKLSKDEKTFLKDIVERIRQKNPEKTDKQLKQIYKNLKTLCKAQNAIKNKGE